jgi:hypothetical protein
VAGMFSAEARLALAGATLRREEQGLIVALYAWALTRPSEKRFACMWPIVLKRPDASSVIVAREFETCRPDLA